MMTTAADYERIARLAAYVLAVVYTTGVGVVSLRLAQFGITGMGLLREQYIFAGTWALLPLVAISVIVGTLVGFAIQMYRLETRRTNGTSQVGPPEAGSADSVNTTHTSNDSKAWTRRLGDFRRTLPRIAALVNAAGRAIWTTLFWVVLAAGMFSYAVNKAVPAATSEITIVEVLVTGGKIALFAAAIGFFGAVAVDTLRATKDKWNYALGAALTMTTAILVVGYLSFFAVSIYARIPSSIGGGGETHVRLVLNVDLKEATRLGIPTDRAKLLFVTSDMYYIVSPRDSTRALGIPRTAILSMETLR
jgi:hypothetical protein